MRRILFLFSLLLNSIISYSQSWEEFRFESGDLLFQDMDCGGLCEAIKTVTPTSHDRHPTHVGLAYVVQDSVWVIEAWESSVHLIPLRRFLFRNGNEGVPPKVMVGRVSAEFQNLAGRAVGFALEQRGRPYDSLFEYDNGRYYAAELIFDAYKAANRGKALFDVSELNFSDPKNWKILPFWKSYFEGLNVKVPEGRTGFNAASLANDDNVEIVTYFY